MFKLNNEDYNWSKGLTVEKLLEQEEIDYKNRAMTVKINGEYIWMKEYPKKEIEPGDDVLIIQFAPGG